MKSALKICIAAFIILTAFNCRPEENLEPSKVDTFIKLIGDPTAPTYAVDIKRHPDGGYVLLANAAKTEEGIAVYRPKLVKVDDYGTIEWSNTMPEPTAGSNLNWFSYSLKIASADKFLIAAENRLSSGTPQAMVIEANSTTFTGHVLIADQLTVFGSCKAVEILPDNKLFVVIQKPISGSTLFSSSSMQLDPNTYNVVDFDDLDDEKITIINRVFPDNDNRMYWAGSISGSPRKTQITGVIPGEVIDFGEDYPKSDEEFEITDFYSPQSKYFAIAGMVTDGDEKDIRVFYIANHQVLFEKIYTYDGSDIPSSISLAADGDIIILATSNSSNSAGQEDFMLIKVDPVTGLINFDTSDPGSASNVPRYFGGEATDNAVGVIADPKGGIVMFGDTEFADFSTLLLMKVNDRGEF